ncbi:MAG: ParA family protein [Sulfuricurvum sp.]|jgi:chromosome partitioning protein|uniref:ParA family protein n=1 Tax=Sulfuricurvum sp. TaxID=2025608 RepID=UPI0027357304|nr:ParA family protein [Sulfuricurvum sp.]MDP2850674.1 ParA family protein [Sulfuricurvum sp.]
MNITVVNFKGGVGKSMIAHQLISGFGFYGCEVDPYGSLSDRLPERVERIDIQQKHLEKPKNETIFDFGGFDDIKLDQAISYSDLIIIPFIPTLETIQGTVDTLVRVASANKPILMIPNMSQKENDINDAKFVFEETLGFEIEMFPIPMSVALQTAINENRSITELSQQGGIKAYAYKKSSKLMVDLHDKIREYES